MHVTNFLNIANKFIVHVNLLISILSYRHQLFNYMKVA